jgi:hypothetical protein
MRYVKGIRRIRLDRAEHGGSDDFSCPRFCEDATHGRGALFARFADYPKNCGCWVCSSEAWAPWEWARFVPTLESEAADDGERDSD